MCIAEIRRISGFNQGFSEHERFEPDSPFRPLGQHPNSRPMDMEGWPAAPREVMLLHTTHKFLLNDSPIL